MAFKKQNKEILNLERHARKTGNISKQSLKNNISYEVGSQKRNPFTKILKKFKAKINLNVL